MLLTKLNKLKADAGNKRVDIEAEHFRPEYQDLIDEAE
jgi:hypothetical protein